MTKKSKIIIGVLAGMLLLSVAGNVAQFCLKGGNDAQTVEKTEQSEALQNAEEELSGEESSLDQEGETE